MSNHEKRLDGGSRVADAPAGAVGEEDDNNINNVNVNGGRGGLAPGATAADAVRNIKSPGVQRIEAISSVITRADRVGIFFGVFLVAYAYGLDGTLRYSYQPTATSGMGQHSLTSTVAVMRAVIGAAAQPTAGKIADVFGRVEVLIGATLFYLLGTIVSAVAKDVVTLAAGTAIYQVGYTVIVLLVEVLIADITSTRARVFFSYIPALPFIINTWVSGNIATDVLAAAGWRWGYGMWAVIFPVCTIPLMVSLTIVSVRARRRGLLDKYRSSLQILGARNFLAELFWVLDVIGIVLLVAAFALTLIPLTLAGGLHTKWRTAGIIAPLVIGIALLPVFVFWELRAPHPLVPFALMKDRGVWAPIGIAIMLNFSWAMQGDYLYTILQVSFDFDVTTATRITSLYSFVSVIVGPLLGIVVYFLRRLKIMVILGTSLFMVAFGLLIHFRGASSDGDGLSSAKAGIIAAEVVLGVAGGMFPYPSQASLQVQLDHENLAVMTGVFLGVYNVGSALGNTVSGAMWTQVLPSYLEQHISDPALVAAVYSSPLTEAVKYAMGTPERIAIVNAYRQIQRILCITGICLCAPLIAFALALRNPRLDGHQTLAEKDRSSDEEEEEDAVAA
ncbi:MFS transporter, SIT family, siderophore-iron:H+ symporter [Geosmithia morbida]|uniref:MFS transporter, SIT family, siderophore-iron:H+ symporter n=1 Tax=Geosmithia morbida TaxID=1094350 RepID=A0A9P4YWA4_9HYPO|nr:MFS transporter, SIT family, siderophore-iron:H+ symporter [Geosmithia morbida]KAF4122977.1 MFS transporter, SIT family, siderophore-iron:H+ symporter [Geosmithia morbida]